MLSPHLHLTIQYLYITVYKVCVCSGAGYQGCHCTDSSSPQPWLVFQLLKLKKHLTDQNCQWKQLLVIFYTTIIQSVLHTSHCLVLLSREEGQWAIRSAERIVQFISISKMPTQHQLGNLKVYINKLPFKNVFLKFNTLCIHIINFLIFLKSQSQPVDYFLQLVCQWRCDERRSSNSSLINMPNITFLTTWRLKPTDVTR